MRLKQSLTGLGAILEGSPPGGYPSGYSRHGSLNEQYATHSHEPNA